MPLPAILATTVGKVAVTEILKFASSKGITQAAKKYGRNAINQIKQEYPKLRKGSSIKDAPKPKTATPKADAPKPKTATPKAGASKPKTATPKADAPKPKTGAPITKNKEIALYATSNGTKEAIKKYGKEAVDASRSAYISSKNKVVAEAIKKDGLSKALRDYGVTAVNRIRKIQGKSLVNAAKRKPRPVTSKNVTSKPRTGQGRNNASKPKQKVVAKAVTSKKTAPKNIGAGTAATLGVTAISLGTGTAPKKKTPAPAPKPEVAPKSPKKGREGNIGRTNMGDFATKAKVAPKPNGKKTRNRRSKFGAMGAYMDFQDGNRKSYSFPKVKSRKV